MNCPDRATKPPWWDDPATALLFDSPKNQFIAKVRVFVQLTLFVHGPQARINLLVHGPQARSSWLVQPAPNATKWLVQVTAAAGLVQVPSFLQQLEQPVVAKTPAATTAARIISVFIIISLFGLYG